MPAKALVASARGDLQERLTFNGAEVIKARGVGDLLAAQLLVYPNTDLAGARGSITEKGTGFGLEAADLRWAAAQWVPDVARHAHGDISLLHATDLSGLPPAAVVVTAQHDPLRDEGDAYGERLAAAGVAVVHRCEPGLQHGFVQGMDVTSAVAAAALGRFIADVRDCLRT